jgi:RimJ/RimL family protein N-acetyltransferase
MKYKIDKMNFEQAEKISKWKYEDEYSIYSMDDSQETIDELLDGSYYSATGKGELIGYFCFGKAAQVPAGNESGTYDDENFIDIGLGINPALCGKGLGVDFILQGIEFAKTLFNSSKFRLTVADFNVRAIKVYERAGFIKFGSFVRNSDGQVFVVMVRKVSFWHFFRQKLFE